MKPLTVEISCVITQKSNENSPFDMFFIMIYLAVGGVRSYRCCESFYTSLLSCQFSLDNPEHSACPTHDMINNTVKTKVRGS